MLDFDSRFNSNVLLLFQWNGMEFNDSITFMEQIKTIDVMNVL